MSDRPILRFGPFELDAASGELRRSGDPIKLPPQPFKVLELLARRSGEVVTREEIRAHVWCDDTVVDFEQGLNFCVRRIREVLGDTADAPRFIETLPRRGYRFLMAVTGPEPTRAARVTRLIVLPFRPLRPDPETDFLAFGLPDALTAALGGLQSLVVRSSAAAARFAGDAIEPRRIGVEADVDVIVTGTLLRAGGEVRVATQLTEAASGTLLRSYACQAPVDDLFRAQDDLTQCIVTSLTIPLTNQEQLQLQHDVPANTRGYAAFLRANQLSYDAKQWSAARELYLRSVAEDPGYAPAWARLGRIHHVIGKYLPTGTREAYVEAESAFQRSLELNPDLTITHKLFAHLEVDLGRAPDAMVRLIERARAADPELMAGLVTACRYCGLLDASLAAHTRAIELDPKVRTSVAHTWFVQRDHARVANLTFAEAPYIVSLSLAELGRGSATLPALREFEIRNPTRLRDFVAAARTLLEGSPAESIAAIGRVVESGFRDPEALFYLTRHLSHLGETTGALELFERVVAGGYYCYPAMADDPWLDGLRRKPAFTKLLKKAESHYHDAREAFERRGGFEILGATV
jgi:DNA-binding winged helix-turn-helix (wHTH) protein/tetratricopeptide (TPR) repeat protein